MKKIFIFIAILFSMIGITQTCYAEETTENQIVNVEETQEGESTLEEVIEKEDITFQEQFNDFANKWLTPILSACGGIGGCVITILVAFAKIKMAQKESKEMQEEATKKINEAQEEIKKAKEQIDSMKPIIVEALKQSANLSMFKELVALLLASDPNFANNPYIPQIMKLLDEGSVNNANEEKN